MRHTDVKKIIAYYYGIPAMCRLLDAERAELESEYDGLRGSSMNGMPHGSTPGKQTEAMAERTDALRVWNRLEAIRVRGHVLSMDRDLICGCLDALNGEYKRLIVMRYRDKYSWVKMSVRSGAAEKTIRRRHDRAVDRLGEVLDDAPMIDEVLGRASRARV